MLENCLRCSFSEGMPVCAFANLLDGGTVTTGIICSVVDLTGLF